MSKFTVKAFSLSLDGYGAGPSQALDNPLGVGGVALHNWFFPTQTFQAMHGGDSGTTGVDDRFAARGFENVGAWIIGRNMFGPVRGHCDVFVLTHHASESAAGKTCASAAALRRSDTCRRKTACMSC
jgi:dihydrofolate reductase